MLSTAQRSFAVNEKALKARMKSVGNIGKITKAMKMVAASKMRGDLVRLQNGKEWGTRSLDIMFKSDTYMARKAPHVDLTNPTTLIVPMTSDKGLCGGVNSNIIREVKADLKERDLSKVKIMAVGGKGAASLTRPFPNAFRYAIVDVLTPYNFPDVMAICELIQKQSQGYDKIVIYYNEFKTALSYQIRKIELIPRERFLDTMKVARL